MENTVENEMQKCDISNIIKQGMRRMHEGSMTVEAAIVLPLMLFFLLNLSSVIELIRLHGNLQLALWNTGNRLAVYGHAREDVEMTPFFSALYIRDRVLGDTGEKYLEQCPLAGGTDGFLFWKNEVGTTKDEIDIVMIYPAAPWVGVAGYEQFWMANRYFAHVWNGYEIPVDAGKADSSAEIVYVAEYGQVYHTNRDCTHLQLSIWTVGTEEIDGLRNQWGKSYDPCEKCKKGDRPDVLYVTEEGESYHYERGCPGLKRTIYEVHRDEIPGYTCCSRCQGTNY